MQLLHCVLASLWTFIAICGTWLKDNKDSISAFYYMLVGPVAVLTVIVTYVTFRANRSEQLFSNAIQTFRKHLELAVQWPELAEPEEYGIVPGHKEYGRYEWFLGVLLRACEELLQQAEILPKKFPRWERTIQQSLRFHSKYFCESDWFNREGADIYSEKLLKYIHEIVRERRARVAQPAESL
jgi:hypothetical protein